MANAKSAARSRVSTGIAGLDGILGGGFFPNRLCLVEGSPGMGKTTLARQFPLDGVARGEKYRLATNGITVGPPLTDFQGVLIGVPTCSGQDKKLLPRVAGE